MEEYKTGRFTPLTITVETLQILAKQPNNARLIALYMGYVEITTWQHDNSIKATTDFMAKRFDWGVAMVRGIKSQLMELGLVEDVVRKDESGKVFGHFILIKHVLSETHKKPHYDKYHRVVSRGTSANDLQLSANDSNTSYDNSQSLLMILNKTTGRNFRTLPSTGMKKLMGLFTLDEIEQALSSLMIDEWHKSRIGGLSSEYLLRSTTIDKFLSKPKPMTDWERNQQTEREMGMHD